MASSADLTTPTPLGQQQSVVVMCPRALVGRLIGKAGTTVKGIQLFSNAIVEVDQTDDPSRVILIGTTESLRVAQGIVNDIIDGKFKGFALLRQLVASKSAVGDGSMMTTTSFCSDPLGSTPSQRPESQYAYAPGVGLFPQRQVWCCLFFSTSRGKKRKEGPNRQDTTLRVENTPALNPPCPKQTP